MKVVVILILMAASAYSDSTWIRCHLGYTIYKNNNVVKKKDSGNTRDCEIGGPSFCTYASGSFKIGQDEYVLKNVQACFDGCKEFKKKSKEDIISNLNGWKSDVGMSQLDFSNTSKVTIGNDIEVACCSDELCNTEALLNPPPKTFNSGKNLAVKFYTLIFLFFALPLFYQ